MAEQFLNQTGGKTAAESRKAWLNDNATIYHVQRPRKGSRN